MSDSYTVTPDILSNMGSLDKLLTERGYTTATVPMEGERVVRNPVAAGDADVRDPEVYAVDGVFPQQQVPGVTPQPQAPVQPVQVPQPQISQEQYQAAMAYATRMQQQAQAQAERNQEIEDQRFLDSIAHLPQVEQDREILIRYNQQLEQALTTERGQRVHLQETQEEAEQREAKADVAWTVAMQHRLHWENPAVQDLMMAAEDKTSMLRIAGYLATLTPRQQMQVAQQTQTQAQTPAQVAAQVRAAPGRGSGGTRQSVKPHSGDIAGYLKAKPYQLVNG